MVGSSKGRRLQHGASLSLKVALRNGPLAAGPFEIALEKLAGLCHIWHTMSNGEQSKPLFWVGSSRKDLKSFPLEVRRIFGFALFQAQAGAKHIHAKPLKGFGGAGVLEVFEDHEGSTFRAVYTVKFAGAVYVLHSFQKKSKRGAKTPMAELDLIRRRLKAAEEHHEEWHATQEDKGDEENGPEHRGQ